MATAVDLITSYLSANMTIDIILPVIPQLLQLLDL